MARARRRSRIDPNNHANRRTGNEFSPRHTIDMGLSAGLRISAQDAGLFRKEHGFDTGDLVYVENGNKLNRKKLDRKEHGFDTGDLVYVENGNKLNRKKLDELRIGSFEITEKISDSIYKIKTGRRNEEKGLFHKTKLIPLEDITVGENY
ncbi:hypothetical protein QE152_g5354 [Popillia japonica]|uniref:Uncharacterized protein n=1 Tax=Popillia japonica TaxID=7064 RepID=A0AAW1MMM8_POPJA